MRIPTSYTILTKRFRLRLPCAIDFPYIFSATRHKGFNDGMQWDAPNDMNDMPASLEKSIYAWKEDRGYGFTIESIVDATFRGKISIRRADAEGIWDIGFWTHPDYYNQGVMSECAQAVLDFGFNELQATRIESCHAVWNEASEKVLQKIGLRFVKFIEEGLFKNGEWVPEHMLAIDKEEWIKNG